VETIFLECRNLGRIREEVEWSFHGLPLRVSPSLRIADESSLYSAPPQGEDDAFFHPGKKPFSSSFDLLRRVLGTKIKAFEDELDFSEHVFLFFTSWQRQKVKYRENSRKDKRTKIQVNLF